MTPQTRHLYTALAIGTAITLLLFGLGYALAESHVELSYKLYWQGLLLQDLVPCTTVGEVDLCKSVPLNATLFWAGIPLGIVLYSAAAWLLLRLIRGKPVA